MQLVRIGLLSEQRGAIVVLEGVGYPSAIVLKVEHEAIVLLRARSVQARESLHGWMAIEKWRQSCGPAPIIDEKLRSTVQQSIERCTSVLDEEYKHLRTTALGNRGA
jgi:hypothetical protein